MVCLVDIGLKHHNSFVNLLRLNFLSMVCLVDIGLKLHCEVVKSGCHNLSMVCLVDIGLKQFSCNCLISVLYLSFDGMFGGYRVETVRV